MSPGGKGKKITIPPCTRRTPAKNPPVRGDKNNKGGIVQRLIRPGGDGELIGIVQVYPLPGYEGVSVQVGAVRGIRDRVDDG